MFQWHEVPERYLVDEGDAWLTSESSLYLIHPLAARKQQHWQHIQVRGGPQWQGKKQVKPKQYGPTGPQQHDPAEPQQDGPESHRTMSHNHRTNFLVLEKLHYYIYLRRRPGSHHNMRNCRAPLAACPWPWPWPSLFFRPMALLCQGSHRPWCVFGAARVLQASRFLCLWDFLLCFIPTCQVRVVSFYVRCPAPPRFLPSSAPDLICQALACSGHRRTSSASLWSQWYSPDLICELLIAVVVAGPLLPALDRSGPCQTQLLARDRSGPCRTSTGESLSAVGLAGPQLGFAGPQSARFCAPWASPDLNRTSTARNKAM